jgi:primosomal protein N' (replication factor Y)
VTVCHNQDKFVQVFFHHGNDGLEVLKQVMDKRITRLTLMKRAGGAILPKVNLIDMRAEAGNALSLPMMALLCLG